MFYLVPTPIGNYDDITIRSLKILEEVDIIICEDSRVTDRLLKHHGIKKSLYVYNDHSDETKRKLIIQKLLAGLKIAMVSDAGTPLISDPGYKLINKIQELGIKIFSLPGACSVITGLTLSGLPTDRFSFIGFLAKKQNQRINQLKELKSINCTLVFFESPKRLIETLKDMNQVFVNAEVAVIRELTKPYEEVKKGDFPDLIEYYITNQPKGEIIIIVHILSNLKENQENVKSDLINLLSKMSVKDAVSILASKTSYSKKELYNMALEVRLLM